MKRCLSAILILLLLVSLGACKSADKGEVFVVREKSMLRNFKVEDGQVRFSCSVCFDNTDAHSQVISLIGNFTEDVKGGLVKERWIPGESEMGEDIFLLPPGETTLELVFIGTFAGTAEKQSRLLPEIEIVTDVRSSP